MFENRVLRKIFGAKIERGTSEWRKLNSVDLMCGWPCIVIQYGKETN